MLAVNCILAFGAGDADGGKTRIEVTSGRAAAFPWSRTTTGRCSVSVAMERLPFMLPARVAANLTVKLLLCPAARVNGVAKPTTLKPVPLTVA
jgi:hypothetical protein